MDSLAILIPVLRRPHRVKPTLDAFAATTPQPHCVYWIPDPDDREEIAAIEQAGGNILFTSSGGYAAKVNEAIRRTIEPLIFFAADDLEPQPGWLEAALQYIDGGAQVVGINDLIERDRAHTTHFLVTRDYAMRPLIDGEPGPLCEEYDHSYTDDELLATATHRGVYAYAESARVLHLHPDNKTAPRDATYDKGRTNMRADRKIWRSRRYWFIEQSQGE